MKTTYTSLLLSLVFISLSAQTPLVVNDYSKVTSYDDLSAFVEQLDNASNLLTVQTIGQSVEGRNIYVLKFSASEFGSDPSKIKVLFFAQQHGNEQSGKEGALMLAEALLLPENSYLFETMDFALIPQVNPDGSEVNKRRNANDADLNRNHLILTEPETMALHQFFDSYLFEVSMDVHEYSPYGEEWKQYGYRKNADVTLGVTTNPNIAASIRNFSITKAAPFVLDYLSERSFSSFAYCPGGPPEIDYIRYSTFDINDGRQSLGIQNTLSFIQEGMNGTDTFLENIQHRAEGQMTGMRAMLEFVNSHNNLIKNMVTNERKALVSGQANAKVAIQMDHFANGTELNLPLFSYATEKDTLVIVKDFRPIVKSVVDVEKPVGYLISKQNTQLIEWCEKQALTTSEFKIQKGQMIQQYFIKRIDSIDFERDIIINPIVELSEYKGDTTKEDFVFVPTNQLKGNMIVQALEPKSMLGLVTYKAYANQISIGEAFPVLRVMNN